MRFWKKLVEDSFWENLAKKLKRRGPILPSGIFRETERSAQSITAAFAVNQSMPKMTSMSELPRTIKDAENEEPPISIGLPWLILEAAIVAPGERTINRLRRGSDANPFSLANLIETKECDAPESNKTRAGTELTGSIPITTPGTCSACAALTQLARATVDPGLVLMLRARGGGARTIEELGADLGGGGGRALFFNGQFQFRCPVSPYV